MATQLFLRNTAFDLGGAGRLALSAARGTTSTTKVTGTVASGNDIQVTATSGGQALEWLTGQLNPITVTGNITVNIRGLESATAANAAAGIKVERCDSTGNVVSVIVPITSVPTASNEYTTADTAKNAVIVPTSTVLAGGDRIKVTLYVRAASGSVMGGGRTVTNSIDGPSAGAAGDTYLTLTENLSAFSGAVVAAGTIAVLAGIGAAVAQASAMVFPSVLACAATIPTPPRPQAQFVKMVGDAVKPSSGKLTTLTLAAGINVPVGNRVVVGWAGSLTQTSNATSCDDSKGNSYSLFGRAFDPTAEIVVAWFTAPITAALAPGDTVTVTQGGLAKDTGWIVVEEWSGLTVPGQFTGQPATSSTPSSGPITMDGGSVYFGMLGTHHATTQQVGTLGSPWTARDTQGQTSAAARWYGVWDQQLPTGGTVDFAPSLGASTLWAAGIFGLTAGTEPPTPALLFSWVGAVTTTSMVVTCKSTLAQNLRLVVSTEATLANPVYSATASPDGNGYTRLSITGLSAGTQYYYGVDMDGVIAGAKGAFATAPSGAASFSFAVGSCSQTQAQTSYTRALARGPKLAIIHGDFPYADVSANDQNAVRSAREALLSRPEVHDFVRHLPAAYTWSDHDFGSNNANTTSASKPAVQAVYRQQVPHHPLVVTDAIYHSFVYGRIRFILTDNRSYKSVQTDTDNSSKTVLGTTQKTWFKNLVTSATEPLIFWVNEQPWIGTAGTGDDEWSNYSTERTELANHIAASGKRVVILSGDMHAVAYDNGANSAGAIPVFHCAPWANAYSSKGGPYTQGPLSNSAATIQQYGIVDVTDSGTTIQVRVRGFDSADAVQVDATLSWVQPTTIGAVAGIGAAGTPTGATVNPQTLACVATLPDADAMGDPPSTQPDTIVARAGMGADIEPPTVPTGLHVVTVGPDSADLAWNASTDNVAVAFYELVLTGPV